MTSMRVSRVFLVILVAIVLGWLGALYSAESGWPTPSLGYPSIITLAAAIVLELILGIRVLRDRERPVADRMNPVPAPCACLAGTYAGAAIGGWAGILVHRCRRRVWARRRHRIHCPSHHGVDPGIVGFIVNNGADPAGGLRWQWNHNRRPSNTSGAQPTRDGPTSETEP